MDTLETQLSLFASGVWMAYAFAQYLAHLRLDMLTGG